MYVVNMKRPNLAIKSHAILIYFPLQNLVSAITCHMLHYRTLVPKNHGDTNRITKETHPNNEVVASS